MPPRARPNLARLAAETAPAPVVPENVAVVEPDEREDEMLKYVGYGLQKMHGKQRILLGLMKEYGLDREGARKVYDTAAMRIRELLDDESTIDASMLATVQRLQTLRDAFYEEASAPIPERVLDVPGPNPDDPEQGAVYRMVTLPDKTALLAQRTNAAGMVVKLEAEITKLIGRRSARWHDRPAVVAVGVSGGLTDEDRELLKRLGM